jgi:GTP-binding protein
MSKPVKMTFLTSAAELHQLPATHTEVAVVGRSNVGKSSLLNALAGQRNLAKVSSKPGRTQLLNCFSVGDDATVVDLPGYGYASTASKKTRAGWHRRMERYLLERDELALVFLLIDGEVGPTKLDREMLAWLRSYGVPFQIVATKHDKVKSSQRQRRKRELVGGCGVEPGDVIWVSAEKGVGLDRLRDAFRAVLDVD